MRHLLAVAVLAAFALGCPQPLVTECGESGQTCCNGAQCGAGLECGSDNQCRVCGAQNQGCCGGEGCNADLVCDADRMCRGCGGEGQGCCAGTTCSGNLVCGEGAVCRACGGADQGCCANSACAFGLECFSDQVCRPCGKENQDCCSGEGCQAGLECAEDQRCHVCGGHGEICCGGARCAAGAECRPDGLCRRCGAPGEPCCSGDACQSGLRCDPAGCVAPCGDACLPDTRRCNTGGGVDYCGYSNPPCTSWSTVVERCAEDQVCRSGACESRCPNACTLGSSLCTSEGLQLCVYDATTGCPIYQFASSSPDNPSCMTGACDGSICWEGPLPQGNRLAAITGSDDEQLLLLDHWGNLLRRNVEVWSYESRADRNPLEAIANCAPSRGFAVGERGVVLRRNSAGWFPEAIGDQTVTLSAVACSGNLDAIAGGSGGRIFAREAGDDGLWRSLPSPTTEDLRGAAYLNDGEGWLVGRSGTIVFCSNLHDPLASTCTLAGTGLTTANLNAAWVNPSGPTPYFGEVVIVGDGGVILTRPRNGGWSRVAQGVVNKNLYAVHGLPEGNLFVAGQDGAFAFRGQVNWSTASFTSTTLNGVYASDGSHLFVVGDAAEIWFNDNNGGDAPPPAQSWRQFGGAKPTREMLYAVDGAGSADVYAVGSAGAIVHKNGDAWRPEAVGLTSEDLHATVVVSADEVYAFGGNGTILARRSGVWRVEGAGVTSNSLFAAMTDGATIYAVGPGGTWLEKPVGASGTLWHLVSQPFPDAYFMAIAGNQDEIWGFGAYCTAVRKVGTVFTVETIAACNGEDLTAAWEGANGEMYLGASFDGLLLHRVAGNWQREYATYGESINAFVVDGSYAWALCDSGELWQRTAGAWRPEAEQLTSYSLLDAYLSPEGDIFMVGGGGLIWHRR